MTETVDLPAVGKVNKTYVYAGGALVVGIVGYAWFARGRDGAETLPAVEPDFGATDYVDPSGGAPNSGGDFTEDGPDEPRTNAEWSQRALDILVSQAGFDAQLVTTALGKYLARQSLSVAEKGVVIAARALVGDPPVGGPYPITDALPTPNPSPNPPPPAGWKGPVMRKYQGPEPFYSIRTQGAPGGRWTWEQIVVQMYINPPPPGPKLAAAAAILRLANAKRMLFRGTYKWGTYPTATAVTVPRVLAVY